MKATRPDDSEHRLVHRLLFFTDAVFAIAMTLLVLELKPPVAESGPDLVAALRGMTGHFIAFTMSFALAGVFWIAHMNTLRRLEHFDWPTVWANLVFLFAVTLIPFSSALLGEAGPGAAAWQVYSAQMVFTSAATTLLLLVASRDGGRLMDGMTGRERAYRTVRAASPGIAFAAGFGLAAAGYIGLAHLCWVLIPVIFWIAHVTLGPRKAA
ncbi:putative membrane protein [Caulobacter ginsengisoli]|uniref:Membrane protein n=1 Tax=Caulobacter ginsengisoli TaxID=400775 RepID=A0ABU0IX98_9CAUL|nr:TMEM175 family protein [Caulobacter ginsengisoli]MDQ0465674.1 putative membrane protein [Caulobacter ginsengisoli]